MLKQMPPVYPENEKVSLRLGMVLMYGIIAPDGSPQSLKVLSSPSQGLSDVAVAAVRQWRYEPKVCDGVPTQVDTFIHVIFSLGN
jgi:TonB family protein